MGESKPFELIVTIAILWSTVAIGVQTEHSAQQGRPDDPIMFLFVMEFVILCVFIFELSVRLLAEGWSRFVLAANRYWNLFDSTVVFLSVIEISVGLLASSSVMLNLSMLRIVRIARLMKFMRIIRVMRFFRHLRILVTSIVGAMRALIWAMILLNLLIYAFAVFLTDQVTEFVHKNAQADPAICSRLQSVFGSMGRSSLTLFECMIGGLDWGHVYEPLMHVDAFSCALFLSYIALTILAMLNVITGVFCEEARQNSSRDVDNVLLEILGSRECIEKDIRKVFDGIDVEQNGIVKFPEFYKALQQEHIQNYFEVIGLAPWDAIQIFHLINPNEEGGIDVDSFVEGVCQLRGTAKMVDIAIMRSELENFFNRWPISREL